MELVAALLILTMTALLVAVALVSWHQPPHRHLTGEERRALFNQPDDEGDTTDDPVQHP